MSPEAPPGSAAEEANVPIVKRYTAGGVTVVWRPALCIRSKICWHGLPEVFNPRERPWVDMNGANAEQIIAQVKSCPSGALSIERVEGAESKTGGEVRVRVMKDGPLIVEGTQRITLADGREELVEAKSAYCRCGASCRKPFCDGSHIRIGFRDTLAEPMSDQSITA